VGVRASRSKRLGRATWLTRDPTIKEVAAALRRSPATITNLLWKYSLPRVRIHVGRVHRPMVLLPKATVERLRKLCQ
jgi:hypothetical protein